MTFIMPWFAGGTSLHRGKDMHQSGILAAPCDHLGDNIFFAEVRLVDVFDRNAMRIGELMRVHADALAQRAGKHFGIVEYLIWREYRKLVMPPRSRHPAMCP